jgi:hypothetical protein
VRRAALSIGLLGVIAVFAVASAAAVPDGTVSQDITWLNAQRAANGIPSAVSQNLAWSTKCDAHVTYMQKTHLFGHVESPSSPYFSAAGSWAGLHSILAFGLHWGPNRDPWETAPLHLILLMDPQLASVGLADRGGYICMTSWPGFTRTPPGNTTVVTYPGDGGTIAASEYDKELPVTPQGVVGLHGATGPNLLVYVWGPVVRSRAAAAISITDATLTGAHGSVQLKWVDHTTPSIGPYLPVASGILIPVEPLDAGATYTASVTFSDHQSHSWTFKTK